MFFEDFMNTFEAWIKGGDKWYPIVIRFVMRFKGCFSTNFTHFVKLVMYDFNGESTTK